MVSDYHLSEDRELIRCREVGPVIDLRVLGDGLEGTLRLFFGEGDQEVPVDYQGRLARSDDSFAFHATNGETIPMDTDRLAFLLAYGNLQTEKPIPMEREFLREWISCFFPHHMFVYAVAQKRPERYFRGKIIE